MLTQNVIPKFSGDRRKINCQKIDKVNEQKVLLILIRLEVEVGEGRG